MLEEEKKEELLALLAGKKYRELKSQLIEMNEVDIASFIEELDSEKTVVVFRMLPKELASEVFACLEVEQQQHIITSITDNELRAIIDDLYVDDAVACAYLLDATCKGCLGGSAFSHMDGGVGCIECHADAEEE